MKDKVFIAWSGSNKVALLVKKIFEESYNYVCSIGGNSDNNSNFSSVGDTVIQQIKSCNQAIVIFQKKADGTVSNNLFFELGYVLATYGQRKVHCVKRAEEAIVLPSDFDSAFVEGIKSEPLSDEAFAQGIVDYFMSRQKMSITENKMYLINNRYLIRDKMASHYSELGSKCSDYELAQYILFYLHAGYMFGDEKKIQKEFLELKQAHNYDFSPELSLAVNMSITYLDLISSVKSKPDNSGVYIEQDDFWRIKKEYEFYLESAIDDEIGVFNTWAQMFINEHLNFLYMLLSNNDEVAEEMRGMLNKRSLQYAYATIKNIEDLSSNNICKENNDNVGFLSLFRAYVYRNIYISKLAIGEADALDYLKMTLKERLSLKNKFGRGTVDTQLYDNFCMEYYLSLISYLGHKEELGIDEFEIMMYKSELKSYLKSIKKDDNKNAYLDQIAHWCEDK